MIILTQVLEHLRDPSKLVVQLRKLLDLTGVVLLALPNENTLFHRIRFLFGKGVDDQTLSPDKHLHFPTIQQSDTFVGKYFVILEKRYHMDYCGRVKRFISWIPRRWLAFLANVYPQLFARTVIYLCRPLCDAS